MNTSIKQKNEDKDLLKKFREDLTKNIKHIVNTELDTEELFLKQYIDTLIDKRIKAIKDKMYHSEDNKVICVKEVLRFNIDGICIEKECEIPIRTFEETMTIKDLKELIKDIPDDYHIRGTMYADCIGDYDIDLEGITRNDISKTIGLTMS